MVKKVWYIVFMDSQGDKKGSAYVVAEDFAKAVKVVNKHYLKKPPPVASIEFIGNLIN